MVAEERGLLFCWEEKEEEPRVDIFIRVSRQTGVNYGDNNGARREIRE